MHVFLTISIGDEPETAETVVVTDNPAIVSAAVQAFIRSGMGGPSKRNWREDLVATHTICMN